MFPRLFQTKSSNKTATATGVKARWDAMEWPEPDVGQIDGMTFYFEPWLETSDRPGHIVVKKDRPFFDRYVEVLDGAPSRKLMELGIWRGGSAILFATLFDVEKFVAIDINEGCPGLEEAMTAYPIGRRIAPYYGVSQDDAARIGAIVDSEFDGPVDIIIDDASHRYAETRRSFEILFPRLAPGGWYVIEDWGWAHTHHQLRPEEPSMAPLIFELQLAWYNRPDLIEQVVVKREMVFVQKAAGAPATGEIDLESLYWGRQRVFQPLA